MGQMVDWHGGPWVFSGMVDWHGGTFFWVFSMLFGVSGVKSAVFWAFFWVFLVYHGFFWVFSGLIGIFSRYFRWPGF